MKLRTYGIRHHGPGSARALRAALEADPPEVLAVEMPADFGALLKDIGLVDLRPPIAMVAYVPMDVSRALYYPLASFSPEWVAMRWAVERGIPIEPVDLPAALMVALADGDKRRSGLRVDPLGEIAQLAGYTDRERWWGGDLRGAATRQRDLPRRRGHDREPTGGLPRGDRR